MTESGNGSTEQAAYFVRESQNRFRPTVHVGGGWNPNEQHIAPVIGLLAHAIETDCRSRRSDALLLSRLSCDILGTIPMEAVDVSVTVLRPGRTIELVEARVSHGGRAAVVARAWLSAAYQTGSLAGSEFPMLQPLSEHEHWGLDTSWPGGFVRSVEIWHRELGPGRVSFWLRSNIALLEGEPVSPTARMLRIIDVANGVAARAAPEEVLFPNLDLSAHIFRQPQGELIGLDTTASFGPEGAGLTHSVLYDEIGPLGVSSQILTVRPR